MLGGTLAFISETFRGPHDHLFKGLSYKTTWNIYGYNLKTPTICRASAIGQRLNGVVPRSQLAIHFESSRIAPDGNKLEKW